MATPSPRRLRISEQKRSALSLTVVLKRIDWHPSRCTGVGLLVGDAARRTRTVPMVMAELMARGSGLLEERYWALPPGSPVTLGRVAGKCDLAVPWDQR